MGKHYLQTLYLTYYTALWVSPQYPFAYPPRIMKRKEQFLQAKVVTALIDFTPLWETMRRKQVTQYQLLKNGLDNKTLDTLKKNRNITLSTLEKLCQMLDCTPNDVVQFIPDAKK